MMNLSECHELVDRFVDRKMETAPDYAKGCEHSWALGALIVYFGDLLYYAGRLAESRPDDDYQARMVIEFIDKLKNDG